MAIKDQSKYYNPNNPGTALYAKGGSNGSKVKDQSKYYDPNDPSTALYVRGTTTVNNGSSGTSNGGFSSGGSSTKTAGSPSSTTDYASSIANAILAQKQAALDNAIGSVNSAYDRKAQLLRDSYNSSVNSLRNQYNNSAKELQNDAAKSLKEAYINKMLSQRVLGQQLSAQGFSGGATESSMAGLLNNYGNARNNINTTLNDNLTSLNNTLQNNLASVEQGYNSSLADAELARASALAQLNLDNANADLSSLMSSNSTFMKQIQNALANQGAFSGMATEAINDVNNVNTQQGNNMGNATQYARLAGLTDLAQQLANSGYDSNAIARSLSTRSVQPQDIQYILNQLG